MGTEPGKLLIIAGVVLILVGSLWILGARVGLGRVPGDVVVRGKRWTFVFPIVTCLVISAVVTLVLWLVRRIQS